MSFAGERSDVIKLIWLKQAARRTRLESCIGLSELNLRMRRSSGRRLLLHRQVK
jgi:hypothetical protein